MNEEMQRRQAELNRLPVQVLDAFEVFNVTLPEAAGQRVIDVVLTTLSPSHAPTTLRVRLGPDAAAALARDLDGAQLRARGTPPATH